MSRSSLVVIATAAVVGLGVSSATAKTGTPTSIAPTSIVFGGPTVQLSAQPNAFSHAAASFDMVKQGKGTRFTLRLSGIDRAAAGTTFGAHLHSGPCVAGDGAAAGPHYNVSTTTPPVVSRATEVWLDFTVKPNRTAISRVRTPFTPVPGDRSVVIHAMPTAHDGTAGARLTCLPVSW